jgi:TPR repeat protein
MSTKASNLQKQEVYYRPSGIVNFVRILFMWLLVLAALFAVLYFSVMPKLTEQAATMTYERMSVEANARRGGVFNQQNEQVTLPSEIDARWQLAIRNQVDAVLVKVEARLGQHYILLLVITGVSVTLILALFSFMQATREEKSEYELRQTRRNILEDWSLIRQELDSVQKEHEKSRHDQDTASLELEKVRLALDNSLSELERSRHDLEMSRKDLDVSRKSLTVFRREQDTAKEALERMQKELDEHDKRSRLELEDLLAQTKTAMNDLLDYTHSADSKSFKAGGNPPQKVESIFTAENAPEQVAVDNAAHGVKQPAQANAFSRDDYRAMEYATLESMAEKGDSMAVAELGYRYFMGIGVSVDYAVSVEYSRRAADMGNATAQVDLGFMYMQGLGVPQDNFKAFEYYQKAADQNHDLGELNLGFLYVRGQGVRQDFVKAFEMFNRAANQGNVLGMLNLGVMYEHGDGVQRNLANAIELYRMAAERGNVKAMMFLAEIYDVGNGTAVDPSQAMYWLIMAANTGNTDAMLNVARRYISGTGVQADILTAYTYMLLYNAFESREEGSKVNALMDKFGAVLTPEQVGLAQSEASRLWAIINGQPQQNRGVSAE